MRKDEDFKPTKLKDDSIVYTNLDEVCKDLPEWGNLLCYICKKPITTPDPNDATINFFRFEHKGELWYKVFHSECYDSNDQKELKGD